MGNISREGYRKYFCGPSTHPHQATDPFEKHFKPLSAPRQKSRPILYERLNWTVHPPHLTNTNEGKLCVLYNYVLSLSSSCVCELLPAFSLRDHDSNQPEWMVDLIYTSSYDVLRPCPRRRMLTNFDSNNDPSLSSRTIRLWTNLAIRNAFVSFYSPSCLYAGSHKISTVRPDERRARVRSLGLEATSGCINFSFSDSHLTVTKCLSWTNGVPHQFEVKIEPTLGLSLLQCILYLANWRFFLMFLRLFDLLLQLFKTSFGWLKTMTEVDLLSFESL